MSVQSYAATPQSRSFPAQVAASGTDKCAICLMLQVSKRSLQRYRTLGILPYLMLRQKTYYKESDVERFLAEHIDCFQKEKMADYKARIR